MPLDAYLANGTNYETVRLIALSDRFFGRDSNYDVMFDSALEAIREDPGTYARGVADVFWEFLMQRPIRESVAPREQTAPEPPAPTFESDGVVLPNPQATILLEGVPYGFVWCASDYIDSCTLQDPSRVWDDPPCRSATARSSRRFGNGTRSFRRGPVRRGSRRSSTGSRRAFRAHRSGSRSARSRWCGGGHAAGGRSSCSGPPPRPCS